MSNPDLHSDTYTVAGAFRTMCRWNAGSELIIDGELRYTGARLAYEAACVAESLQRAGIMTGDRVAFLGANSARYFAAFFGAHLAGATTCNIHPRETPAFLGLTLRRLNARAIVCDADQLEKISAVRHALPDGLFVLSLGDATPALADLSFDDAVENGSGRIEDIAAVISPDDLAVVILSSGSTGTPKGILHSQSNFVRWMRATPALFGHVERGTRFLVIVGTSFAAWPFSAVSIIYAGGTLILMREFNPEAFCAIVERERVTMAGPVPTMIRMLEPSITSRYDLSSFRMMLCAGEPPSPSDIERILSWADTDIRCLYLASESAPGAATLWQLRDQTELRKPVCAGRPVPGADVRIVDPDGTIRDVLPAGQSGEIVLRGPTISLGYLDSPELTAQRFVDGWWRSGDLGHLDTDGFLYVEGRTDNTINTGGIKVQGEEVELCLLAHPGVLQAAVIGVPDPKWGKRIDAFVAIGRGVGVDDLFAHCRAQLAAFKVPKNITVLDKLPVGATGKLDRMSLRKEYGQ
ncbi:MAG: class I adenylate-forming enzyme family protein [Hyphomonas sp.]|nr:acyl--CoA ligase [Hyphomonas sp.]